MKKLLEANKNKFKWPILVLRNEYVSKTLLKSTKYSHPICDDLLVPVWIKYSFANQNEIYKLPECTGRHANCYQRQKATF